MSMTSTPTGLAVLAKIPAAPSDPYAYLPHALPQEHLSDEVNHWRWGNQDHYLESWERVLLSSRAKLPTFYGTLAVAKITAGGVVEELGLVGHRAVTDVGVRKIIAFMNKSDVTTGQNFLYHGIGKTATADVAGDTNLLNELSTEYATPNTRPGGSQGQGASQNVYRTAATIAVGTVGVAQVIVEHGVFSAAARGSGVLLDRSAFGGSSISLNSNEAIAAQYDMTMPSNG